jgi:hypothetical protein
VLEIVVHGMNNAIKIISIVGKFAGIVAGLNTIPAVLFCCTTL